MDSPLPVTVADLSDVAHSAESGWQSDDLLSFNGSKVRYRTMNGVEARWHSHEKTDEMFFVLTGRLEIDVIDSDGLPHTHVLGPNQMLTVRSGCEHRARSEGLITLLVLDAIDQ